VVSIVVLFTVTICSRRGIEAEVTGRLDDSTGRFIWTIPVPDEADDATTAVATAAFAMTAVAVERLGTVPTTCISSEQESFHFVFI